MYISLLLVFRGSSKAQVTINVLVFKMSHDLFFLSFFKKLFKVTLWDSGWYPISFTKSKSIEINVPKLFMALNFNGTTEHGQQPSKVVFLIQYKLLIPSGSISEREMIS